MAEYFAVAIEGLSAFDQLDKLDPKVIKAARMAVNDTVREARKASARSMEQQVKFPQGYLTGQAGRLKIAKFASNDDLSGIVRGRDEPTSLARFVVGGAQPGRKQKGVSVEVDPGIAKYMPSAFAIRLKNNNIGLAYRTKDGKAPSVGARKLGKGLWLLYGPSVDQVFNETRNMIKGDMEAHMKREFERLLELNL
ncbi:phage tail protein [Sinorhizobium meliloti]|uniref:phage tail protein n=1 Tax=Rhizobium meliloti TaxID=382 RepID=UPI0001E4A630|nr:phage tail protein [Sinorhizobium meliloti]AEG53112.1 hypothetical protein Sinme_1365 [Sinorhizobium meliloti AK83]MDE4591174.1 phage tail protein [Sinorhizobium meliloti]SEI55443.1 Prophage minor tail protein Z (GPZ) [Sinorhizobium meliloti]